MSKTLLLADDSVTIQRVIQLTFADEDIEVVAVGDGQQAIDRIKADPPDIVLADTGMPERDGYEVAAFVKGDPALAGIPVVLLTGAFEPLDERRVEQIGANGVLVKPFEPQLVIKRVHELLEEEERRAAAARAATASRDAQAAASAPGAPAETGAGTSDELDTYFDQLDDAFTDLDTGGKRRRPLSPLWKDSVVDDAIAVEGESGGPLPPAPSTAGPEHDFGSWDLEALPRVEGEPSAQSVAPAARQWAAVDTAGPRTPGLEPSAQAPGPAARQAWTADERPAVAAQVAGLAPVVPEPTEAAPLANAFAALLAAEQGVAGGTGGPGAWPGAAPAITDELIDDLAQRILERLTDRVIREAVADAVGGVAERLVREEIERIKAGAR